MVRPLSRASTTTSRRRAARARGRRFARVRPYIVRREPNALRRAHNARDVDVVVQPSSSRRSTRARRATVARARRSRDRARARPRRRAERGRRATHSSRRARAKTTTSTRDGDNERERERATDECDHERRERERCVSWGGPGVGVHGVCHVIMTSAHLRTSPPPLRTHPQPNDGRVVIRRVIPRDHARARASPARSRAASPRARRRVDDDDARERERTSSARRRSPHERLWVFMTMMSIYECTNVR